MRALAIALALIAVGCGSKESISLSASVSNVQLNVTEQALGTQLSGGFDLSLEVGPEADGAATVSLEKFALVRADDKSSLVDPLGVIPSEPFPLQVGKGQEKTVPFQLDDQKLLPAGDKGNLCAGQVQLVGAVKHTLGGGETKPFTGMPVSVGGC